MCDYGQPAPAVLLNLGVRAAPDPGEPATRIGDGPDGRPKTTGDDGAMDGYELKPGAVVEIHGHRVGEHSRTGEVLEVLGETGHEHFRVRWEDGRESIFYPSSDAQIRPARPTAP